MYYNSACSSMGEGDVARDDVAAAKYSEAVSRKVSTLVSTFSKTDETASNISTGIGEARIFVLPFFDLPIAQPTSRTPLSKVRFLTMYPTTSKNHISAAMMTTLSHTSARCKRRINFLEEVNRSSILEYCSVVDLSVCEEWDSASICAEDWDRFVRNIAVVRCKAVVRLADVLSTFDSALKLLDIPHIYEHDPRQIPVCMSFK